MCGLCSYHYVSLMVAPADLHFFPLVICGIWRALWVYNIFNSILFVLEVIQELVTAFLTRTLLYCDSKNLLQVLILRSQIHKLASTYFGVLHQLCILLLWIQWPKISSKSKMHSLYVDQPHVCIHTYIASMYTIHINIWMVTMI